MGEVDLMFDRVPAVYRHALILLLGAVLTYAADNVQIIPAQYRPLVAALVGIGTLIVTPLTRQYGVGHVTD